MSRGLPTLLFLLIPLVLLAAVTTITSSGDWSDSTNWSGGVIADDISDDATMNNNIGEVTILNGESFSIGELDMGNGNTLTIDAGGSLTNGSMSDNHDLITNNSTTINVDGDLEIWGNLVVNNSLILNVTGTLTVHGDVNLGNGAGLDIQGDVTIDGDFNGGNGTDVNVDGDLDIGGDIDVGNGSTLTGGGTVTHGGTCSGPSSFCTSGPLPIELIFFEAHVAGHLVQLTWATASEINFDFFIIERSTDAQEFYSIGTIPGNGFSETRIDYHFQDQNPIFGRSFYRLKATDLDGSIEYFEIASVQFANGFIEVFPNPISNTNLKVFTAFEENGTGNLRIFNKLGQEIINEQVKPGPNEYNLSALTPGIYYAEVRTFITKSKKVKLVIN